MSDQAPHRDQKTVGFGTEGGQLTVERENGLVVMVHIIPERDAPTLSFKVERNVLGNVSYVPLDGGQALRSLEDIPAPTEHSAASDDISLS